MRLAEKTTRCVGRFTGLKPEMRHYSLGRRAAAVCATSRSSVLFSCMMLFQLVSLGLAQSSGPSKMYRIEAVSQNGVVTIATYDRLPNIQTETVTGVEIWQGAIDGKHRFPVIFYGPPDAKRALIEYGFAKLTNPASESQALRDAEETAKRTGLGLWPYVPPPAAVVPVPESPPARLPDPQLSVDAPHRVNWRSAVKMCLSFLGILLASIGLPDIVNLYRGWRQRNVVRIALIGLPSVGKSWIWKRLESRDVPIQELEGLGPSIDKTEGRFPELVYRGMRLVPTCVDLPGHRMGDQVNELLTQRRLFHWLESIFFPKRLVWLVVLASTPRTSVSSSDPFEKKVDTTFLAEQLGFLSLPRGVIEANKTILPRLVVACLTKVDLFCQHPPTEASNDPTENGELARYMNLYEQHTTALEKACKEKGVAFVRIPCSARMGWNWGFSYLDRELAEKALS
jgi:hypothetical protein